MSIAVAPVHRIQNEASWIALAARFWFRTPPTGGFLVRWSEFSDLVGFVAAITPTNACSAGGGCTSPTVLDTVQHPYPLKSEDDRRLALLQEQLSRTETSSRDLHDR